MTDPRPAPLPPAAARRLGQILALAEAEANPADAERLAALTAGEKLLGRYGLRLRDLPALLVAEPSLPEWATWRRWREVVMACRRRQDVLTDWEAGFLRSLGGFGRLSARQHEVLDRIARRVLRAEPAGAPV